VERNILENGRTAKNSCKVLLFCLIEQRARLS
jgi:hypothetical protein